MTATDSLIAVWGTGKPVGATGTDFQVGFTAQQKIDAINTWMVLVGAAKKALLNPSDVLNAIVAADYATLAQSDRILLGTLLSGSQVDASQGTNIRAAVQNMFAGKTATLSALSALVAPYDNPRW